MFDARHIRTRDNFIVHELSKKKKKKKRLTVNTLIVRYQMFLFLNSVKSLWQAIAKSVPFTNLISYQNQK